MSSGVGMLYLGKDSSEFYERKILDKGIKEMKIIQTDFKTINSFLPDQFDRLKEVIRPYLKQAESKNIEQLIIPNITLHETIDQIQDEFSFAVIHPVRAAIEFLKNKNIKKAVLFGTTYTMNKGYIVNMAKESGVVVNLPTEKHQLIIESFRKKVFYKTDSVLDRENYLNLLRSYSKISNVLLACTELSLIHETEQTENVLDMASIQLKTIV
jgi:aspartate racemase